MTVPTPPAQIASPPAVPAQPPTQTATAPAPTPEPAAPQEPATDPGEADWKSLARKHEARSKENHNRVTELEQQLEQMRRERLSETELAILAARDEATAQVRAETARDRARDRFVFEARLSGVDEATALADLEDRDLGRYVTPAGEPDLERITAAVSRLAPAKTPPVSAAALGQGGRGGSEPPSPEEAAKAAIARGDWRGSLALKAQQLGTLGLQQPPGR